MRAAAEKDALVVELHVSMEVLSETELMRVKCDVRCWRCEMM